jgi:DNA-directed RNA polymerase specialized sigma24 family protein
VAHEATTIALRRVRQHASRFDPDRGTPTMWVIGAAEYAWIDVAKTIVAARRSEQLVFTAPEDLLDVADPNPSTEEHVLRQLHDADALADAASCLTIKEFAAIRLVVTTGYSYAETAQLLFGDPTMTKQVDGLLTRAKAKLAKAWEDRRPSPGSAGSAKFANRTADEGRSDA